MGMIKTLSGRGNLAVAPAEIADEVENYARESGRHATIRFVPTEFDRFTGRVLGGTWRVDLDLHPDDKRMESYQQGKMARKPVEEIWLHEENPDSTSWRDRYRPLDIIQMGASGVRNFLERGNIHSGRGEFKSMEEVVRKTAELNTEREQRRHDEAIDRVRMNARGKRRSRLKIPFLGVGIDLRKPKQGVVK